MLYETLVGKVVMVTGASSGLGKATAEAFAVNGAVVYASARNLAALQRLARENARPGPILPVQLDVRRHEEVMAVAGHIVEQRSRIDIWVNNAGGQRLSRSVDLAPEDLDEITALNYYGVVYGMKAAGSQMLRQEGGGDIVNVLSTNSFIPRQDELAYCGAKAAAMMAGKVAGMELRPKVRVIQISPGGMKTDFQRRAGVTKERPDEMLPERVADAILYAVSAPRNMCFDMQIYRNA